MGRFGTRQVDVFAKTTCENVKRLRPVDDSDLTPPSPLQIGSGSNQDDITAFELSASLQSLLGIEVSYGTPASRRFPENGSKPIENSIG